MAFAEEVGLVDGARCARGQRRRLSLLDKVIFALLCLEMPGEMLLLVYGGSEPY